MIYIYIFIKITKMHVRKLIEKFEKIEKNTETLIVLPFPPPLPNDHPALENNDQSIYLTQYISQFLILGPNSASNMKNFFDYLAKSHIFDYKCFQGRVRNVLWDKLIEFENVNNLRLASEYNPRVWVPHIRMKLY
jgi:hypothetical protein